MNSLELIEDYFNGLLTATQKEEFEKRVLSDPSFAEDLAFYLNAHTLLKEELAEEKKARFKTLYEQIQPHTIPQKPVRKLWLIGIAASLLAVAVASWLLFGLQSGPDKLADRYIQDQLKNLPVKMSSVQDSLQQAIALYNKGSWKESLEILQHMDTGRAQVKIDAGIVNLRLQHYDKALAWFEQLESDTTLYNNPALFYQSITLMKRNHPGDSQKARQLLQLVVDRDLDKKEDAQLLLLKHW